MLVIDGLHDQTVLPEWVKGGGSQLSPPGAIEHSEIPDARYFDLRASANHTVSKWILDRFAGTAPGSNCVVGR
jgi:hypothetical protein